MAIDERKKAICDDIIAGKYGENPCKSCTSGYSLSCDCDKGKAYRYTREALLLSIDVWELEKAFECREIKVKLESLQKNFDDVYGKLCDDLSRE